MKASVVLKLCQSSQSFFIPTFTPSETLHSEKLDLTEICRFRCLMSSPPSAFYFFSEDLQQDMCPPYKHTT